MSLTARRCWTASACVCALMSLAACGEIQTGARAAEPEVDVTFAVSQVPEPASTESRPPPPLCEGRETTAYSRLSNGWGHGSPYFSMLSRCSHNIRLDIDFYTEADAIFGYASDLCPGVKVSGQIIPKTAALSEEEYVLSVREHLDERLAAFRKECGLRPTAGSAIFDGFGELYREEMAASWIHNRYIEKLVEIGRLGWGDEEMARQAREEYAAAH